MAIKAVVNVTEIERNKGKQGPWIKIHYSDSKGPHKLAVFDPKLQGIFVGNGSYYIEIDKPEGEQYWKLLTAENRGAGTGSSSPAPHIPDDSRKSRSIQIQTAMKATAEVLAGAVKPETDLTLLAKAIRDTMKAFVSSADEIERADKEAKEVQDVPF